MTDIISFDEAMKPLEGTSPHLLLGNGFSRALRDDIFAYGALLEQADFDGLSPYARGAFDILETTNFEFVIKALRNASKLAKLYEGKNEVLEKNFENDAEGLKNVLVNAIAKSHPDLPSDIPEEKYAACKKFLSFFNRIFTVNYDLLLYWAVMQDEIPPNVSAKDGFRTPDEGPLDYVIWEPDRNYGQNIYYLHGALHLFDTETELQKYTWVNTGVPLIDQIRLALDEHKYPLFVAEGSSNQKVDRIRHNDYLSKSFRSLASIQGTLLVYGMSFSESDSHIISRIEKGRVSKLIVSVYGDENSDTNQVLINNILALQNNRPKDKPLEVRFFQAESASVWGE